MSGHTTGTLRGYPFGTVFAEDVTLEPGAGRTLTSFQMVASASNRYFGTMRMMFATRSPGQAAPDMSKVFATADITVAVWFELGTWIADFPVPIEAPHERLWVMWTFGENTLGNPALPMIGCDGSAPSAGATDERIYIWPGGSLPWQTIDDERWVLRLDAVPSSSGLACLGLGALASVRRRR